MVNINLRWPRDINAWKMKTRSSKNKSRQIALVQACSFDFSQPIQRNKIDYVVAFFVQCKDP